MSTNQTTLPQAVRSKAINRRVSGIVVRLVLCGIIVAGVVVYLRGVWQASSSRELYLPELREQARQQSLNGPLQALLGVREAQAGHYATAAACFQRAIADGESDDLLWRTWAASLAAAGEGKESWAALQLGMEDQSRTKSLRLAVERVKRLPATASPPELAAAISPEGFRAVLLRYGGGSWLNGLFAATGRRHPESLGFTARESFAQREPRNPLAQRLWGEALVRNERYVEADKVLQVAVSLQDTAEARLALGKALAGQGASAKAGMEYIACLKLRPDWVPAMQALGRVALDKQLIGMSLSVYQKLVEKAPNDADSWIGLGRAWYNQKLNLKGSLDAFQKAVQLAPGRTDFYNDYSNALRANFRMQEAETVLQTRLVAAPQDAQSHFLLALLLLDHNPGPERQQEAEAQFRECLRLEPTATSPRARLGRLLVQQGHAAEAIPLLQTCLTDDRYDISAASALARAYRLVGRTKEAASVDASVKELSIYIQKTSFLEDLLHRSPLDIKLHRQLASLYERGGQPDAARLHLETAYLLEHNPQQAGKGLKNLMESTSATGPIMTPDPPNNRPVR